MNPRSAALLLLFALPFPSASAQEAARDYGLPVDPAFEAAIERGSRRADGRPGDAIWRHGIRYRIEARLDPASAELEGREQIEFRNGSRAAVDRIPIHLRQNIHTYAEFARRLEDTGGVRLGEVTLTMPGGEAQVVEPRVDGTVMTLMLPEALPPGAAVNLRIDWRHRVPLRGAPRQGRVGDELFYLGYWYPQIAVQDDVDGWVAEQYRGSGEFYMPYADYEIAFSTAENYLVQATGSLQNPTEVLAPKQLERLAAAAGSDETVAIVDGTDLEKRGFTVDAPDDVLTWRFRARNVRDVAVSCGRNYLWDAVRAKVPDRDEPCVIHSFYRPDQEAWKRSAMVGKHTIEFGSRLYPYPWPHMSLCEGASGGGMEYPMMTTISAGNNPRSVSGTIIHETIHMWFPMIAGSNEKRFAWMDEGMTSCLTAIAGDELYGGDGEKKRAFEGYRVMSARRDGEEAMMIHGDAYTTRGGYGNASYAKPSAVFHQLRMLIGDETFRAALRAYLGDWAFKHPRPEDLFATFARVSNRDLDWYFREWCHETWKLDLAITDVAVGAGRSKVTVADLGQAIMPAVVELTLEGGASHRLDIAVADWKVTNRIILDVEGRVVRVKIDPDDQLLDVDRANNLWEP
ncbi:MAG: M1 family metallopeptidase [Planctomycetes bacterium]|nr:M1 family metallopeptidase [Planctomycetota bacterium]